MKNTTATEQGTQHHMEACRALLNVPDDEVLYQAIKDLQEQLSAVTVALTKADTELAAEREKLKGWRIKLNYDPDQLREQLAAERENHERAINVALDLKIERDQLREQLAAEREQVAFLKRKLKEEVELHEQEEKQFSVAVEKLQKQIAAAVEALKELNTHRQSTECYHIIDAALAKMNL